jgi:cation diffusion facilitator family transporter
LRHDAADGLHNAEGRTRDVALLTFTVMGAEWLAGWWFNSMALLADGWHMGARTTAIGLSALACGWARARRDDPSFAFGTWKVEVLAAFSSAVVLFAAAVGISAASLDRLLSPLPIRHTEAMLVAALGLSINLVGVVMLRPRHDGVGHFHSHADAQEDDLAHERQAHMQADANLNLRSARLHTLAGAATSALAIVALAGGLWWGWDWLDPLAGIVVALTLASLGAPLMRDCARVLLDREMDLPWIATLRHPLEDGAPWGARTRVVALHTWRVGRSEWACVLHLASTDPALSTRRVRWFFSWWPQITQLTVQIDAEPLSGAEGR